MECGLFVLVDAGRERVKSQAIRPLPPLKHDLTDSMTSAHSTAYESNCFKSETPLGEVLSKMVTRISMGKTYNPTAIYVPKRKNLIDWMCTVGEELSYKPDAIHHSVAIFDAYHSIPNIEEIRRIKLSQVVEGKSQDQLL